MGVHIQGYSHAWGPAWSGWTIAPPIVGSPAGDAAIVAALLTILLLGTYAFRRVTGNARSQEEGHLAVLDAVDEVVVVTNLDGKILRANGAVRTAFQLEPAVVVGRFLTDFVPVEPGGATASPEGKQMKAVRADGTMFPVEVRIVPIPRRGAGPASRAVLLRDLSERARAQAESVARRNQEEELARLQEENRFKSSFLNAAAHELGTPLTPMRIQLHLLEKGQASPEDEARSIEMIRRNFERLAALVRDILDAGRIESSRLTLQLEPMPLEPLVREAVESYRALAESRDLHLSLRTAPAEPVMCDPRRTVQIIVNLLSNAVKFTQEGGHVEVNVRGENGSAIVSVHDDGLGLAPDQIGRLFRPFSQVHELDPRRGGTGLGLFIARGIVEASRGSMSCRSDGPGQGTTFEFRLPYATSAEAFPSAPRADRAPLEVNYASPPDPDAARS